MALIHLVLTILAVFRCEEISLITSAMLVKKAASWEITAELTLHIIVISSRIKDKLEYHQLIMLNSNFLIIEMATKY